VVDTEENELKEAINAGATLNIFGDALKKTVHYKIPFSARLKDFFVPTLPLWIALALVFLGGAGIVSKDFYYAQGWAPYIFLGLLLLTLLMRYFTKYAYSSLASWALENVRCPACNGTIGSCACRINNTWNNYGGRSPILSYTTCEVQCKNCNRKFVFRERVNQFVLAGETT
jgi:hypothetical protein